MMTIAFMIPGFFLLIKGAEYLVEGATSLAKRLGIPTLVIGLTIVAFGTSMPELIVNIIAAFQHNGEIAFGNVIGSNVANILLILGVATLFTNLKIHHSTIWKEIPFSILAVLVLLVFANASFFDDVAPNTFFRFQGLILILFFCIFLFYVYMLARQKTEQFGKNIIEIQHRSGLMITVMIIGGLGALYFGGEWVVEGAVAIAKFFGMSEYVISLTVVAVGTSLPELATSIVAARKNDSDLAVGNVIGSNIFNIFWILGISALIVPLSFPAFATIDLLILLGISLLLFFFMFIGRHHELERWQGYTFLFIYIGYTTFLLTR